MPFLVRSFTGSCTETGLYARWVCPLVGLRLVCAHFTFRGTMIQLLIIIYLIVLALSSSFPSNLIALLSSPPSPPCLLSFRLPHNCHPSSSSGCHPACRHHHCTVTPIIFLIATSSSSPFHMAVRICLCRHLCPFPPSSLSYSR